MHPMLPGCALVIGLALVAGPVNGDELQDAMDRANALNLFIQIELESDQAQRLIEPLERIQDQVTQYRETREAKLQQLQPTLRTARQRLIAGRDLSDDVEETLEQFRTQREQALTALQRSVDAEMQLIAERLSPEQNSILDWTPPESVRPQESVEERLKVQRVAMGRIQEAAQMLDRVKHLDPFNFVTGRMPLINDYLALYYEPNTQQFQEASQIVLNYTDEIRGMNEQAWQENGMDIAAGMVDNLGLMPTLDRGQRPGTVSWQALYRLVTDPQTLEVVRDLADR